MPDVELLQLAGKVCVASNRKIRRIRVPERQMVGFYKTLSEKDRRRYAAMEAVKLGHGGIRYMAGVLGCSRRTIENGIKELDLLPNDDVQDRIRRHGGGRKKASESQPDLVENFLPSGSTYCG